MTYLVLSETDKIILDSYKTVIDGLAEYLGSGYELILHSLDNLEHSVIKIVNGHYTGRVEGAPITNLALKMLDNIQKKNEPKALCYFNKKNGSTLKSATIPIVGENARIIGLLCINFHTEVSFSSVLASFTPAPDTVTNAVEIFTDNVDDLILGAVEEAKVKIYANPTITTSNKNKEIIRFLYEKGIFNMKDAVIRVADYLGLSKNTVYLHLRNLEN
ncbi:MAG: PAS domain-containing protein [Clostridium sp.]